MSFWSGETIKANASAAPIITPFLHTRIDCAAYTLRMGGEYFVTPEHNARFLSRHTKERLDAIGANGFGGAFQIPPGQFAFLLTEEYLKIPSNVLAFISLKSTTKFRGLINVSGFHVDPGFEGHLIYAVYNAGPNAIHMQRGQDLFLIWFSEVDDKNTAYFRKGKLPQKDIDPKLITDVSRPILSPQSMADKIAALETRVDRIYLYAAAIGFLAGGIIAIIVNWNAVRDFLTGLLPTPT